MRRGLELADAGFVDVACINEDAIRGGILQQGVEFEGRDERASIGDGRGFGGESDEMRDEADGELCEAASLGEMRGNRGEGGSGGQLEVDGREGEAGVREERSRVGAERGEGAGDSDIHAVGGDAKAAPQRQRRAQALEVVRHARRLREGHELVV